MATIATGTVSMQDIGRRTTVTVRLTGVKRWQFRMWLAMAILRFALWVMPCKRKVERTIHPEEITSEDILKCKNACEENYSSGFEVRKRRL